MTPARGGVLRLGLQYVALAVFSHEPGRGGRPLRAVTAGSFRG